MGRKYKEINLEMFSTVVSPNVAYVLGFIATDGCLNEKNKSTGENLQIVVQERDSIILEKIRDVFCVDNAIYARIDNKGHSSARIRVYHSNLISCLSHYNITPRKSLTLRYPLNLKKELHRHFIRGVFDGDGYAGIYGKSTNLTQKVEICSASLKFLMILSNKLTDGNIQFKFRIQEAGGRGIGDEKYSPRLHPIGRLQICRGSFHNFYDYLYKDANIYLPRKKQKFEQILKYRDKSFEISSSKTVDALFN
jgi:hypothetical protein